MTNVHPKTEFDIYVTHVEADGPLLKIFGQTDQKTAECIEKMMAPLAQPFSEGRGQPLRQQLLDNDLICCGMFEKSWFRAQICTPQYNGSYVVRFIDYGNTEILESENIRVVDGIPEAAQLIQIPPQSFEYTLAGVLPRNGIWDGQITENILKNLQYKEYRAKIVGIVGKQQLISLLVTKDQPLTTFLVSENLAIPATIDEMLRAYSYCQQPKPLPPKAAMMQQYQEAHNLAPRKLLMHHHDQPQQQQQQQQLQPHMHPPKQMMQMRDPVSHMQQGNYPQLQQMPPQGRYRVNSGVDSWRAQGPPVVALPSLRQPKSPIQLDPQIQHTSVSAFTSRTIAVDTKHQVTVSYVESGPSRFFVQLQSTANELASLMQSINGHTPQPLVEPPVVGFVCLGRNTVDKRLFRAVVKGVTELSCTLYYVDYGHSETLSFQEIYQIPPKYTLPPIMAISFTLDRVNEIGLITEKIKQYFTELVRGKTLLLHVKSHDLLHRGDLYEQGHNILEVLRTLRPVVVSDHVEPWQGCCKLSEGAKEIVLVTYVETCSKFYVQLDREVPDLERLMIYIGNYANTAPPFKRNQLTQRLQCIALSNTSNQWSRAEIVNGSADTVTVYFVDYGNMEALPLDAIRPVCDAALTQLRAQAIRCILNGYEKKCSTPELDNNLEAMILEQRIPMIVKGVTSRGPIVDLFDSSVEPLQSILVKLVPAVTNGNIPSKNSNDNSQNTGNISARSDEQGNKWNPTRDSPRIQEPSAPPSNSRANNWKEDENEQRRPDNRYQNRGNDRERSMVVAGGPQNDRFSRDEGKNDRFPRDGARQDRQNDRNDRYERPDDSNANIRGGSRGDRAERGSGSGRYPGNNSRSERNGSADKSWSDKDSDTSSRGSGGKHGRRDSGGRGGYPRREPGPPRNNGDSDRNFKPRSNGSSRIRDARRDFADKTETKQVENCLANKTPQVSTTVRIPPPNITVGAVKYCDLVFMDSPTDFQVQLTPDNLELEAVMANIAATYQNGGKILPRSMMKPGTDCVAQYSDDDQWYRATIQSVEANGAVVYFVDYGNSETVNFEKIKEIDAFSAKLAAQAIACKLLAANKSKWDPSEVAKFGELAENKNLEAEFVALDNKVYDILLREVLDGTPSTKYINEEFSAGADLNQAKNAARNKKRQTTGRTEITEPTDYVALDYKWNVDTKNPGDKENVIVTWFINPDNFFCQTVTQTDEFKTMMNDMQQLYAKRPPITEPLQVGSAVIAVFSEDGAMYRAEIVELNKARGNIVRYIDFGNCAMVEPRNIYRVEKRFTKMPKQAFQCAFKNIVPANGSSWSKANRQEIDKCFNSENYECTFHEIKDGKHIISLNNGGVDVAGQLVDKSLAAFAVSGPVAADNNAAVEKTDTPQVEESPRFDISLLAGQVLRVKVSNVASIAKFHVQLPSATVSDKIIDAYMAEKDPKVMPRLSFREVCLGAGCLVNTDEGWRRAVVVNCSRTTGFDVRLIDTGANDEIPLDCMLALPGELSVMQNQAVECSLKNSNSSVQKDEEFRDQIENKDVIIVVEEVDNNRLIVDLYSADGKKIKISPDDTEASICPVCPMAILHSTHQVIVAHAEDSGSMWLKRSADMATDADLLSDLFEHYDTSTLCDESLSPGDLCAAKSADDNWYRAKMLRKSVSGVTVQFLDYGNTEEISVELIRRLEPKFHVQSQLAIEVALTVTLGGSKEQQQEILNAHTLDKEFTATLYNVRKNWVAELTDNEGKISEKLSALSVVEVSKNPQVQAEVPEMVVGGRYKVVCPHADSPAQFWLQREEEIPLINEQQEKLQTDAPGYPALEGVPQVNTLCVAMYSGDDEWYRAEVCDADQDIITIRFIDYGNTDVIDTNTPKIKQIPDSFKTTKRYATKCRLDVIPSGADDWTDAACEFLAEIVTSTEIIEALVIADSDPRRVELFVNAESVVEALVSQNHATKIRSDEDLVNDEDVREIDSRAAYVSHATSPSEFWVQKDESVLQLESLPDRLSVADMFPKVDEIKEGLLCVAKDPLDGIWYRARVLSHTDDKTEVFFIDWGSSTETTETRAIPQDLATLPDFAKKCRLVLPDGVERWSAEAEQEFIKIADEGATVLSLDVIEEGQEISTVRLTKDGRDIVERLAELCPRSVPVIEERLPPLGEENSPNVLVSYVSSPSEFWTHEETRITELNSMKGHLVAAESFLPLETIEEGTICAAKCPEDNVWYRAKVLSHGDAGTEVLYIDYGDSTVTTELRRLPEDIVNIPALSMCCSLDMPEDIEAWSEEACEKFFELVCDGNTMFQFEILEKREQTLIKLTLDGKDIVETLTPLCAKKISQELDVSIEIIEVAKEKIIEKTAEQKEIEEIILDDTVYSEHRDIVSAGRIVTEEEKYSEEKTYSSSTSGIGVTMNSETISSASANLESTEASSSDFNETESKSQTEATATTENTSSTIKSLESAPIANGYDSSMPESSSNVESTEVELNLVEISATESFSSIVESSEGNDNRHEISVPENGAFGIESSTPEVSVTETTKEQPQRPKTPVEDKILPGTVSRGLTEEEIIIDQVERLNSVPIDQKILPGSINKGDDLENETVEETRALEETLNVQDIGASEEITNAQEVPASEETTNAQEIKATEEAETAQEIKATEVAETVQAIEATKEAETAQEIEATKEAETAQVIQAAEEAETAQEIEATEEAETAEVIEATKETGTAQEINISEKLETAQDKVSNEKETPKENEASNEKETAQEIKSSSERETLQETEALNEKETPEETKASNEKETPREIEASKEEETPQETEASREKETTQETTASSEKETSGEIKASSEKETPQEAKASKEKETLKETKASKENELKASTETKTPRDVKPLIKTEPAPKISSNESENPKKTEPSSTEPSKKIQIEDKILPGSISRVESPFEGFPTTPKTPHADKLVAGVVNLQEKLTELEADESLTVVVDENIPK